MRKVSIAVMGVLAAVAQLALRAETLPACEPNLEPEHREMPPFVPARTEHYPRGSVVAEFTVLPTGMVTEVTLIEVNMRPFDELMEDYIRRSVMAWHFAKKGKAVSLATQVDAPARRSLTE